MVDLRTIITEAVYSSRSIDCADAILAALDAAGLVVVPMEPTEEMSEAGHEAVCDDHDQDGVFRYMLAVSPYVKKEVE